MRYSHVLAITFIEISYPIQVLNGYCLQVNILIRFMLLYLRDVGITHSIFIIIAQDTGLHSYSYTQAFFSCGQFFQDSGWIRVPRCYTSGQTSTQQLLFLATLSILPHSQAFATA